MATEARFPIVKNTVIPVTCDHSAFIFSGDEQITCVRDQEYGYGEEPACVIGELCDLKFGDP